MREFLVRRVCDERELKLWGSQGWLPGKVGKAPCISVAELGFASDVSGILGSELLGLTLPWTKGKMGVLGNLKFPVAETSDIL